mgnify:CR=1 FL=1
MSCNETEEEPEPSYYQEEIDMIFRGELELIGSDDSNQKYGATIHYPGGDSDVGVYGGYPKSSQGLDNLPKNDIEVVEDEHKNEVKKSATKVKKSATKSQKSVTPTHPTMAARDII